LTTDAAAVVVVDVVLIVVVDSVSLYVGNTVVVIVVDVVVSVPGKGTHFDKVHTVPVQQTWPAGAPVNSCL